MPMMKMSTCFKHIVQNETTFLKDTFAWNVSILISTTEFNN